MGSTYNADSPPALVLGLSPTGLTVIRSLGRRGIRVFGADFEHYGIGRFSKYCQFDQRISDASLRQDGTMVCNSLIDFAL